jgi:hypothetical protein
MPYTIKAFLHGVPSGSQLFKAQNLDQAELKAEELRERGHSVEIWQNDGIKVSDPEPHLANKT